MHSTGSRVPFYASIYLFVVAFYLLSASGRIGLSDSVAMLNVAQSMINDGSLSSEPCQLQAPSIGMSPLCIPGSGGRFYAGYGLVPSLVVVPAILCAQSLSRLVHVNPLLLTKMSVSIFTLLIAPLVCVALAMWILKLGYGRRTALFGASILAFASPFWFSSVKGFLSEPYFTLALIIAACLLTSPRSRFACLLSGLAFGVACGTRLFGVILFPVYIVSLALHIRERPLPKVQFFRDVAEFSTPVLFSMAIIAWTNYVRFGSALKTGYHLAYPSASHLLSNPLLQGMYQLLFNGEVGLLIFAPWVILAGVSFRQFMRAHLSEAVLCGTMFVVNFLFFAKAEPWHGGWVAGPRYLVPTLPFVIVVILPCIDGFWQPRAVKEKIWLILRPVAVVSLLAGLLIQCAGVVLPTDRYYRLMGFYEDKPMKPRWAGSIPLASIDYLSKMSTMSAPSTGAVQVLITDQLAVVEQGNQAWAAVNTATSEEEFLSLFPNPENLIVPNLMVTKTRLMGLPTVVGFGYVLGALAIGVAGVVGLKRYAPV